MIITKDNMDTVMETIRSIIEGRAVQVVQIIHAQKESSVPTMVASVESLTLTSNRKKFIQVYFSSVNTLHIYCGTDILISDNCVSVITTDLTIQISLI